MKKDPTAIETTDLDSSELKEIIAKQIQEIHEKTEEKLKQTRALDREETETRYRYDSYYRGGLNE